jgi:hypothetical protein
MVRWLPFLADLKGRTPFSDLDEATTALWLETFQAGVRMGAELEHVRLALVGPTRSCRRCQARGELLADGTYPLDELGTQTCPDCGGSGTLPVPGVRRLRAS